MHDHDDDFDVEDEDTDPRPWLTWTDAGSAYLEWTDLPIFLFKIVEEVGMTVARLGDFAGQLVKSHANERAHVRYVHSQMAAELEKIVGGE